MNTVSTKLSKEDFEKFQEMCNHGMSWLEFCKLSDAITNFKKDKISNIIYRGTSYKRQFSIVIGTILSKTVNPRVVKILKTKSIAPTFDPSMKTLMRIVSFMSKNPSEGKTKLALDTKLNYTRLAKHVVWMEKKGLVESTIEDNKIQISLTKPGRDFAKTISKIP